MICFKISKPSYTCLSILVMVIHIYSPPTPTKIKALFCLLLVISMIMVMIRKQKMGAEFFSDTALYQHQQCTANWMYCDSILICVS